MSHRSEGVLHVLMHIFRNYLSENGKATVDEETIFKGLLEAGFEEGQVHDAIVWLKGLAKAEEKFLVKSRATSPSIRIYSQEEIVYLSKDCRGLILNLEQLKILDAYTREIVIDRLVALHTEGIDMPLVKWVSLMVLFNQGDQDTALEFMEYITLNETGEGLQ